MPQQVLKQKMEMPKSGRTYIVHSDGFVYEVESKHVSKYYRDEKKFTKEIEELVQTGRKMTVERIKIEDGYLYYVNTEGVARAKIIR